MATFHFELVSPEKLLFSGDVEQVDVPGAEGDFGVLAGHAPFVSTLRPGILTVHGAGGEQKIVVLGGFAEVSAEGLTVLVELAETLEDIATALAARPEPALTVCVNHDGLTGNLDAREQRELDARLHALRRAAG